MEVIWTLQSLSATACLDIFLVAAVIYLALRLVRGSQAASLLRGTIIIWLIVWVLSNFFPLVAFSWLLRSLLLSLAIAVPVIFQQELRRAVDMVGRAGIRILNRPGQETDRQRVIREICAASEVLSDRLHGGLIVIERRDHLDEYINTGIPLDSVITADLLTTAFWPKTELHDGAAIVRANRIAAAACVLPLSAVRRMPDRSMGLRHRAALGISEVSDAVAVVISEESGHISLVNNGRFVRRLDAKRLQTILNEFYGEPPQENLVQSIRTFVDELRSGL
ncbi:MAG: diadenylate cyclase CdaA [Anaerolineae bacterium]|nr:diadenylate cyclase CdaA [Anaerolineae bacterium]